MSGLNVLPSLQTFETESRAKGFHEVAVREWKAFEIVPAHDHKFDVSAVVVKGEMWLTARGTVRHLLPGDRFSLRSGEPHEERYGAQGATYWAARRHG